MKVLISLISSFSNFLTSSHLGKFFRLTALATMLCHLGAISLKNLTRRKEVRKGADQANSKKSAIFFNPGSIFRKFAQRDVAMDLPSNGTSKARL